VKFCFVVRSIFFQRSTYTTIHLAFEALRRSHSIAFTTINDFSCTCSKNVFANVLLLEKVQSREKLVEYLRKNHLRKEEVCLNDFDVVFLRFNAMDIELEKRFKSQPILEFARILKTHGVFVVNDPIGLFRASSKLYLSSFSEDIRAKTLVTKDVQKVKIFLHKLKKPAVIKPLISFGGKDVFFIKNPKEVNINQIISTVRKNGYLIAQEYLPEIKKGDKRLLLFDGEPIFINGKAAIYRRISPKGEIRTNMHIGGIRKRTNYTGVEQKIVENIKPKLISDGLYFVGVDLVGDRLLEINVFCPGGIHNINSLYKINIGEKVISSIEKKAIINKNLYYQERAQNLEIQL